MLIKKRWFFKQKHRTPGRPPVSQKIKNLILEMKNNNLFWGVKKIQGELLKLAIKLHKKTIQNILKDFRKQGKIKKALTWKKFLTSHIDSLFAMDFFTVDGFCKSHYFVLFIICHKTREIVQFAITRHPGREFMKQQIIQFEHAMQRSVYLIRDNYSSFNLDYASYSITDVRTSISAPNMNAIAERFVGSVRREALDYFLIFKERQLYNIIKQYVSYYNSLLPHQGIDQQVPLGYAPQAADEIKKKKVLGGLCHHYYRDAA